MGRRLGRRTRAFKRCCRDRFVSAQLCSNTAEPMKTSSSARRQARLRAAPPGAKAKGPDGPARRLREQRRVHSWARRYYTIGH